MSATTLDSFVSSLSALDVPYERTTPGSFDETLESRLQGPAVGVPLTHGALEKVDVNVDPTPAAVKEANTGVTTAEFAIAEYGSIVIPSGPSELISLFVDRHVAVVDETDIVPGMEEAFDRFGNEFGKQARSRIIATGASATADMGDLVQGVHGPSEVHVIIRGAGDE